MLNELKSFTHVIWDWNGTLIEDLEVVVEILCEQTDAAGLAQVSLEDYRREFCFPLIDYYAKLGFQMDHQRLVELSQHFHESYEEKFHKTRLYKGTESLLETLANQGKTLSVLSLTRENDLKNYVNHFGLGKYVSHIYGCRAYPTEGKIDRGHELLEKTAADREKTVIVGDTEYDYEVGKALGVEVILVADGYQAYERLSHLDCRVLPSRFN
ncbi:MAG: HAD family hydrolase [Deltaproteobacteria bacterium]|nr:HAD family hydrolase [Deltaproteobacteria bacterium]